jgi:beta-glucosidase
VLDGDGEERMEEKEEDKQLMRSLAAQSIVLLKNENKVLPLPCDSLKSIAIIGGNAKADIITGGGSASLTPSFVVNPFEGITKALTGETEVFYAEGVQSQYILSFAFVLDKLTIISLQNTPIFP